MSNLEAFDRHGVLLRTQLRSLPLRREAALEGPGDRWYAASGEEDDAAVSARAQRVGETCEVPEPQADVSHHAAAKRDPVPRVAHRKLMNVVIDAAFGVGRHLEIGAEPFHFLERTGGNQLHERRLR